MRTETPKPTNPQTHLRGLHRVGDLRVEEGVDLVDDVLAGAFERVELRDRGGGRGVALERDAHGLPGREDGAAAGRAAEVVDRLDCAAGRRAAGFGGRGV